MRLFARFSVISLAVISIYIVQSAISWNKKNQPSQEGLCEILFFNSNRTSDHFTNRILTKDDSRKLHSIFQQLIPDYRFFFRSAPDFYQIRIISPANKNDIYTVYLTDGCIYPGDFIDAHDRSSGLGGPCYRLTEHDKKKLKEIIWEEPSDEWKSNLPQF